MDSDLILEGGEYQWCSICNAYKIKGSLQVIKHHPHCPLVFTEKKDNG